MKNIRWFLNYHLAIYKWHSFFQRFFWIKLNDVIQGGVVLFITFFYADFIFYFIFHLFYYFCFIIKFNYIYFYRHLTMNFRWHVNFHIQIKNIYKKCTYMEFIARNGYLLDIISFKVIIKKSVTQKFLNLQNICQTLQPACVI